MNITFDPAKDETNRAKHGVSLAEAAHLEWKSAVMWPDQRHDYGEQRMVGLVPLSKRLFCVVFVDRPSGRPTERRIISLRKANEREVKHYAVND